MLYVKEVTVTALRNSVKTSWRVVRDPLRRSRIRWFMLGWVITIPTLLLGGGFAIAGSHLVIAKGAFAIYARIPGGLHTHGVILLLLGIALVMGLGGPMFGYPEPRKWLRVTLYLVGYYYAWSAAMLALAPAVNGGTFSFVGVTTWTTLSLLPAVLLVGPPPELISKAEIELLRAAIEVGIGPEQAKQLVDHYLHSSRHSVHSD
jgi:hypothetical protein